MQARYRRALLFLAATASFPILLLSAATAAAATDPDSLYLQVHPRLAFTRHDVPSLRAKIHDGGADDAAYAAVRNDVTSVYPPETLAELMNITYGMNVPLDIGLVAYLDTSANIPALQLGRQFTLALADTVAVLNDPFYTSIRLRTLCYGYDLCMETATTAERARARVAIETCIDSLMFAFNFERWLHPPYVSNKTAMTGAALGIAAICLADEMDPPRVAAALARADSFVAAWMRYQLDPDGTCFEGVQYGTWAMRHLAWYFEARRRYDGVDYSQRPDIRRIEEWLAYEVLPERGGVVNNLNDTSYLNHPLSRLNTYIEWAMTRWNSGLASWLWDRSLGAEDGYDWGALEDHAATVLWHRPLPPVNPGAALPRSKVWKERGLYYYRTGWPSHGGSDDVVFSFYSGVFHGGHSQEDQGNFTLYGYGTRFAADNGFDSPNAKSAAHNMVFVDGKGQHYSGSSVGTDGKIRARLVSPPADYLFGDVTAAYGTYSPFNAPGVPFPDDDWSYGYFGANPVEHARREWLVVHDGDIPPYFVLLDDVKKDATSRAYQWRMHTDGNNPMDISPASIRIDGKRGAMEIDVCHPAADALARAIEPFDNQSIDPDTRVLTLTQQDDQGVFALVLRPTGVSMPAPVVHTTSYPWGGTEVIAWPGGITDIVLANADSDTVEATVTLPNGSAYPIRTDARMLYLRGNGAAPVHGVFARATMCDAGGIAMLRVRDRAATVALAGTRAYVDRADARLTMYAPDVHSLQAADTLLKFERQGEFIVHPATARIYSPSTTPVLRVYPLPARQSATIVIETNDDTAVTIDVYDVAGRRVRKLWNGPVARGSTPIRFDGLDDLAHPLSSGIYFARARAGDRISTARIVWLR